VGLSFILLLAVVTLAAWSVSRDEAKKRRVAAEFRCTKCGSLLGEDAVDAADKVHVEQMKQLREQHPGARFRIVQNIKAICTVCGQQYTYDEKEQMFAIYKRRWGRDSSDEI